MVLARTQVQTYACLQVLLHLRFPIFPLSLSFVFIACVHGQLSFVQSVHWTHDFHLSPYSCVHA